MSVVTIERQLEMTFAGVRRRRRGRGDSLPENTRYRDDGCEVSPACLDCPLPRCRYEEPGGLRAVLNERRDREMLLLRGRGVGVEELALRFGVSRRTVFRVLEGTGPRARRSRAAAHVVRDNSPVPIFLRQMETRREANCA